MENFYDLTGYRVEFRNEKGDIVEVEMYKEKSGLLLAHDPDVPRFSRFNNEGRLYEILLSHNDSDNHRRHSPGQVFIELGDIIRRQHCGHCGLAGSGISATPVERPASFGDYFKYVTDAYETARSLADAIGKDWFDSHLLIKHEIKENNCITDEYKTALDTIVNYDYIKGIFRVDVR
jgi:hypothetical protein